MSLPINEFQKYLLENIDHDRLNAIANPHQDMHCPETRNALEKVVLAGKSTIELVNTILDEFPSYYGLSTLYAMAALPIPDDWIFIGDGFIKSEWVGKFWEQVDGKWQRIIVKD